MKVVVLTGWYPNKWNTTDGDFIRYQSAGLAARGVDVELIFADYQWRHAAMLGRTHAYSLSSYQQLPEHRYQGFGWPRRTLWTYKHYNKLVYRLLCQHFNKRRLPEVIHIHGYHTAIAAMRFCRENNIKLCYTEHSTQFLQDSVPLSHHHTIRALLDYAEVSVAVSNALATKMQAITTRDILTLHNPIDTDIFYPSPTTLSSPHIRLVSVGSLVKRKQYDQLIAALKSLSRSSSHHYHLTIIGSGPMRAALEDQVVTSSLGGQVVFAGECSLQQVAEYYRNSHIYVSTSSCETFGLVYAEALCCGIPVVALDSGGVRDIVTESYDGSIVDNIQDLLAAIGNTPVGQHTTRRALHAAQRFGYDEWAKQLMTAM